MSDTNTTKPTTKAERLKAKMAALQAELKAAEKAEADAKKRAQRAAITARRAEALRILDAAGWLALDLDELRARIQRGGATAS